MSAPAFFTGWRPAEPGTVLPRPQLFPPKDDRPAVGQIDPYAEVAFCECSKCGWRFSKFPTRCYCAGSYLVTAPPRGATPQQHPEPERSWNEPEESDFDEASSW